VPAAAALAAAVTLAITLGAAAPAEGAFPGNNGKIAFAGYSAGDYNIWVMNADGSSRMYLTSSPDWEDEPGLLAGRQQVAGPKCNRRDRGQHPREEDFGHVQRHGRERDA